MTVSLQVDQEISKSFRAVLVASSRRDTAARRHETHDGCPVERPLSSEKLLSRMDLVSDRPPKMTWSR